MADLLGAAVALVEDVTERGGSARLLGGAGIAIHCSPPGRWVAHREFADIDLIIRQRDVSVLRATLDDRGYEGDTRFNALNSRERLAYYGPPGKLDVFVDRFSMCHTLRLASRIEVDTPTLSVSDLLLTKLQIVELTEKDMADVSLLLGSHPIEDNDDDALNLPYLVETLSGDWGLWRTSSENLARVADAAPDLDTATNRILDACDKAPKPLRYRARAKIGEKKRWYELPEEPG